MCFLGCNSEEHENQPVAIVPNTRIVCGDIETIGK